MASGQIEASGDDRKSTSSPESAPAQAPKDESPETEPILRIADCGKSYGQTVALDRASLVVGVGEMVGLVGHNGAGKTTLMKLVGGLQGRDTGTIAVDGQQMPERYDVRYARARGVALAMQEISLFSELRVVEHLAAAEPDRVQRGWRSGAAEVLKQRLDEMFPRHGISPMTYVNSLTLAQRQMLQIALSTIHHSRLRLLILDEPTSALSSEPAEQLFGYLRDRRSQDSLSIILVSHKMTDILENTDRTVVMRDGGMVSDHRTEQVSLDRIMTDMGAGETGTRERQRVVKPSSPDGPGKGRQILETRGLSWKQLRDVSVRVAPGEIVGLAGLEANGQQQVLEAVWQARLRLSNPQVRRAVKVSRKVAYVSGNRQDEGLFPLWSVQRNISIANLSRLNLAGLVRGGEERRNAEQWVRDLFIKAEPRTRVTALSGGTQQKVLLARGLGESPDLLILDDPFRGVDVTTKADSYSRLRRFADSGAAIIWYTSENSELLECDRVYVFRDGAVSEELSGADLSVERVIAASFGGSEEEMPAGR
jgi:ribose transport system ATP-binding protein